MCDRSHCQAVCLNTVVGQYGAGLGFLKDQSWVRKFLSTIPKTSAKSSANMTCHHLFADNIQRLCCGKPAEVPSMATRIENCVAHVCTWCAAKGLQLNPDKTEILWFGSAANLQNCMQLN